MTIFGDLFRRSFSAIFFGDHFWRSFLAIFFGDLFFRFLLINFLDDFLAIFFSDLFQLSFSAIFLSPFLSVPSSLNPVRAGEGWTEGPALFRFVYVFYFRTFSANQRAAFFTPVEFEKDFRYTTAFGEIVR